MKTWLACLTLLWMTSCVPLADACGWLTTFQPDPGFETRWTVGEKRQAVAHNRKVEDNCG